MERSLRSAIQVSPAMIIVSAIAIYRRASLPKFLQAVVFKMDAYKLDDVRAALYRGDVKTAARIACVFTLTPVTI